MINNHLDDIHKFKDVVTFNNERLFKKFGFSDAKYLEIANRTSRENARTPVQWDSSPYAGFSPVEPWFGVAPSYKEINVKEAERDKDSILHYYRKLLKIRQSSKLFIYGSYREHCPESKDFYCYERNYEGQKALIICSFAEETRTFRAPEGFDLTEGKLLLCNYKDAPAKPNICAMRPYEARVYLYE